jgi:DnaJ like chaperone protein
LFRTANSAQSIFTTGVVVLGAKMAKADGRVTRMEIEAFKKAFHIAADQEERIGRLFDEARRSADGFEPYAFQLAHTFRRNPEVLEEILTGLFAIAKSDVETLSPTEVNFLKHVAFIFGFDATAFARIAARSGARFAAEAAPPPDPDAEAFTILGVAETASPDEVKKAYRDLIRKHHPDKLIAQGMPPEFVANATEKMKRINVAYDRVARLKGIK